MKVGPKAVLPGAVAESTVADEGFKGNKYQRKIAVSRGISGASMKLSFTNQKIETGPKAVLPGAVAETLAMDEGFKGNEY